MSNHNINKKTKNLNDNLSTEQRLSGNFEKPKIKSKDSLLPGILIVFILIILATLSFLYKYSTKVIIPTLETTVKTVVQNNNTEPKI